MRQIGGVRFPILAIEGFDRHFIHRPGIKTTNVDIDAIGIAARNIKAFDAANFAEQMFRDTSVEGVFGQEVLPA